MAGPGQRGAGGGQRRPGTMPRVVPDQRSKFENEEFFRKLSRECEVRRRAESLRGGPGEGGERSLCAALIGAARL